MSRDITKRLQQLKNRRHGVDRLDRLSLHDRIEALAKSMSIEEAYARRALGQKHTQYAIGAMQAVDGDYTRISIEEAERVGKQLESGLRGEGTTVGLRLQGSVPCNLHIRGVSDVDLLVLDERFFTYDGTGTKAPYISTFTSVPYTPLSALLTLRSSSERILKDKYPAATVDISGNKAIKLSGGSLRRPVDVVPSHWYDTAEYQATDLEIHRGVQILDKSIPKAVLNLPFKHIDLISRRDVLARGGLRKAIRLLKNVKADAVEEGTRIDLPSFDIAACMWHADTASLAAGSLYELAIVAESQRFLDMLARNFTYAQTLRTPDGSRAIFDTQQKLEGLLHLSLEVDDLAMQISREHNLLLNMVTPTQHQVDEVLRKAIVPA